MVLLAYWQISAHDLHIVQALHAQLCAGSNRYVLAVQSALAASTCGVRSLDHNDFGKLLLQLAFARGQDRLPAMVHPASSTATFSVVRTALRAYSCGVCMSSVTSCVWGVVYLLYLLACYHNLDW
jgi:hypothetical protein